MIQTALGATGERKITYSIQKIYIEHLFYSMHYPRERAEVQEARRISPVEYIDEKDLKLLFEIFKSDYGNTTDTYQAIEGIEFDARSKNHDNPRV